MKQQWSCCFFVKVFLAANYFRKKVTTYMFARVINRGWNLLGRNLATILSFIQGAWRGWGGGCSKRILPGVFQKRFALGSNLKTIVVEEARKHLSIDLSKVSFVCDMKMMKKKFLEYHSNKRCWNWRRKGEERSQWRCFRESFSHMYVKVTFFCGSF